MAAEVNYLDQWISEKPHMKNYLDNNPEMAQFFATTQPPQPSWNEAEWKKIVKSLTKSTS